MPFSTYVIKYSCLLMVTCSVDFLATQYTSMDWLMDSWSNEYLRDTRCEPSSKEPESKPGDRMKYVHFFSHFWTNYITVWNVNSPRDLFFPINWQSRWFICSFIRWTFFELALCTKHCSGCGTHRGKDRVLTLGRFSSAGWRVSWTRASKTQMYMQVTWGSCKNAGFDSVALGWSMKFDASNMLLGHIHTVRL